MRSNITLSKNWVDIAAEETAHLTVSRLRNVYVFLQYSPPKSAGSQTSGENGGCVLLSLQEAEGVRRYVAFTSSPDKLLLEDVQLCTTGGTVLLKLNRTLALSSGPLQVYRFLDNSCTFDSNEIGCFARSSLKVQNRTKRRASRHLTVSSQQAAFAAEKAMWTHLAPPSLVQYSPKRGPPA